MHLIVTRKIMDTVYSLLISLNIVVNNRILYH